MAPLKVELPSQRSLTEQNLSRWAEVISNPKLARLEERVETDRFGHIIMSPPPSAHHGSYQFKIGALLDQYMENGRVITECPVSTADGVKATDVSWASNERLIELGNKVCFPRAPEICVEILSPANSETEISEKTTLYFDAGAVEVWHCSHDGKMSFLLSAKERPSKSRLCPRFPQQITL